MGQKHDLDEQILNRMTDLVLSLKEKQGTERQEVQAMLRTLIQSIEVEARQNEVHRFLERSDSLGEEKYATRRLEELEGVRGTAPITDKDLRGEQG